MNSLSTKAKVFLACLLLFFAVYSDYISTWFSTASNYASPIFRCLVFFIGALFCSLRNEIAEKVKNWQGISIFIISTALLVFCIIKATTASFNMYYLLIALIVTSASLIHVPIKEDGVTARVIGYAASLSYSFYILQLLLWEPFYAIRDRFAIFSVNSYKLLLAFMLLLAMSVALRELYEKPIQKFFKKRMKKTA